MFEFVVNFTVDRLLPFCSFIQKPNVSELFFILNSAGILVGNVDRSAEPKSSDYRSRTHVDVHRRATRPQALSQTLYQNRPRVGVFPCDADNDRVGSRSPRDVPRRDRYLQIRTSMSGDVFRQFRPDGGDGRRASDRKDE